MVNVYFLSDGDAPANYTEIDAAYRGRWVKLGATALSTGGADTHTHSGSAGVSNNASGNTETMSNITPYSMGGGTHNHGNSATVSSVGDGDNYQAYKTLRCHYRSTTEWDGSVPSGLAVFAESVPATGWDRFWDGTSYFIMISGTANTTGGGTHSHSSSGTTANQNAISTVGVNYTTSIYITSATHNHTFSGTITGSAYDYYYWSCGMVESNATTYIYNGMYVLFDGDPGAGWSDSNVNTKYLKVSSTNSVVTGGSYTSTSHTHGSTAITSGAASAQLGTSGTGSSACLSSHTHAVNVSLASGTAEPKWVGLTLYQATQDFGSSYCGRGIGRGILRGVFR